MLLLGALFALFIGGFWLYCLADVVLTPRDEFHRLPKAAWIAVVAGTLVIGAVVWLAVRRPGRPADRVGQPTGSRPGKGKPAREESARQPGGQPRPA